MSKNKLKRLAAFRVKLQNLGFLQFELNFYVLVGQQKLLFLGKILKDQALIREYKIVDGAKLMLTRLPKVRLECLENFPKYKLIFMIAAKSSENSDSTLQLLL